MATRASRLALAGSNISATGEVDADLLDNTDSTAFLSLNGSGFLGIGTASPAALLHINGSGDAVRVTSTNTGSGGAQVDLLQYTTSPADNDIHGMINFGGYTSGTSSAYGSSIRSVWSDVSAKEGQLEFFTRDDAEFAARMTINKDGNVGIGDNSPAEKFTIKGDGARMTISSNDYEVAMLGRRGSSAPSWDRGYLRMKYDGTNTIVLDTGGVSYFNGGNVGIGTSSPSQIFEVQKAAGDKLVYGSNPRLLLDTPTGINGLRVLGDTTPFEFKIDSGTYNGSAFSMSGTGDVSLLGVTTTSSDTFNDSPTFFFNSMRWNGSANSTHFQGAIKGHTRSQTNGDGYLGIGANASANHINIDASSGNVGIGTTSPGHTLDVDGGSIRVQDVGQYIYFGSNSSVKVGTANGNSNDLYLGSADDINIESNYIRFWRDGYYGSTEYGRLSFSDDSWLCTGSSSHYLGIGTNNPTERLHVSGNILATGTVNASSDISLKDNITPIPNAIDKVLQIRGVTFNRNDIEDNPRQAGVIAQEVEKVLPEVVSEDKDGIKSVAYGNMVSLLIEAIKEQQEQINMLKEKLENK